VKTILAFTQVAWREQLIVFLILSNFPFRAVEHPEFWKAILILRPDLDIPHRTYIHTHLKSLYKNVQSKLLLDLPETVKVSIALDGWHSLFKGSFLAIIVYYITIRLVIVGSVLDHSLFWRLFKKTRLYGLVLLDYSPVPKILDQIIRSSFFII